MRKIFGSLLVTGLISFVTTQSFAQPDVTITIKLDMHYYIDTGGALSAFGIHVAGNFQDLGCYTIGTNWDPSALGSELTSMGNDLFQISFVIPGASVGQNLYYKFVNGNAWGGVAYVEGSAGVTSLTTQCAADDGFGGFNRALLIPPVDQTLLYSWDHCEIFTEGGQVAKETTTVNVFPNPVTDNLQITFSKLSKEKVSVALYDGLGNCVSSLVDENLSSGSHSINVDATNLSSGIYYCKISCASECRVARFEVQR